MFTYLLTSILLSVVGGGGGGGILRSLYCTRSSAPLSLSRRSRETDFQAGRNYSKQFRFRTQKEFRQTSKMLDAGLPTDLDSALEVNYDLHLTHEPLSPPV